MCCRFCGSDFPSIDRWWSVGRYLEARRTGHGDWLVRIGSVIGTRHWSNRRSVGCTEVYMAVGGEFWVFHVQSLETVLIVCKFWSSSIVTVAIQLAGHLFLRECTSSAHIGGMALRLTSFRLVAYTPVILERKAELVKKNLDLEKGSNIEVRAKLSGDRQ